MEKENIDFDDEMLDLWLLRETKERELNGENHNSGKGLMGFAVVMLLIIIFLR